MLVGLQALIEWNAEFVSLHYLMSSEVIMINTGDMIHFGDVDFAILEHEFRSTTVGKVALWLPCRISFETVFPVHQVLNRLVPRARY